MITQATETALTRTLFNHALKNPGPGDSTIDSPSKKQMSYLLSKHAGILQQAITCCCTCAQAKHDPSDNVSKRKQAPQQLMMNHIPKHDAKQVKVIALQNTMFHMPGYVNLAAGSQLRTA
jgi:hypothetical protein